MKFELTEQEADLVVRALAELPAKLSMNLIMKFQQQFTENKNKADEEKS